MRIKFLKKTTCCLGGNDVQDFEKDHVVEVSEKLAGLLIEGEQAEKTSAKLTATDKPEETA